MKSTYFEKLANPQWQRKRLEIMKRDNFSCTDCHKSDQELHVHHMYYVSGRDPWEYPDWSLQTLCHECHKDIQYGPRPVFESLLDVVPDWIDLEVVQALHDVRHELGEDFCYSRIALIQIIESGKFSEVVRSISKAEKTTPCQ